MGRQLLEKLILGETRTQPLKWSCNPRRVLPTRLRFRFYPEVDYDGDVKVEVALSAQMTNLSVGVTVWTNEVSEVGTVGKRNVPAVVAEMNATMEQEIEKLLTPAPTAGGVRRN